MVSEYEDVILVERSVYVKYDDNYLMAWVDGEMRDDIDYSKFDNRLKKGESFTKVASSLVKYIQNKG